VDKETLRRRIAYYEDCIKENERIIEDYKQRIQRLNKEIEKLRSMQGEVEQFFSEKRAKLMDIYGNAKGLANQGATSKFLDLYSLTNGSFHVDGLDNMMYNIEANINKLNQMIDELQGEIRHYNSSIDECNREIADIERREREERERKEKEEKERKENEKCKT